MRFIRRILDRWVDCKNCAGSGQKNGKTCTACNGAGGAHTETI